MILRKEFEKREQEYLAPYAALSIKSKGRKHPEPECTFRTCFNRDRDRIIHCGAFRRLEYKTQVFVNHEGDYYRTRLTHTLEVAQISRSLARTLRLNEDLAEAIALAHDLGHTPFGHRGETTLNKLMAKHGGFEHNRQSYRVVTLLERRNPKYVGLNLSTEVLEGIAHHSSEYDSPVTEGLDIEHSSPSLEAQIVNVADEIAYMNHDLDDGLESKMIEIADLKSIEIWSNIFSKVKSDHSNIRPKIAKYRTISDLIDLLVRDIQTETMKKIKNAGIKTIEDVAKHSELLVAFTSKIAKQTKELKDFLFSHVYRHYHVERMADKSERILNSLFKTYMDNPKILPPGLQEAIRKEGNADRHICDYMAGMTDRFALSEYSKLFDPNERV